MKAMKETVQLCLSSVFRDQPPPLSLFPSNPTQMLHAPRTIASRIPETRTKSKVLLFLVLPAMKVKRCLKGSPCTLTTLAASRTPNSPTDQAVPKRE